MDLYEKIEEDIDFIASELNIVIQEKLSGHNNCNGIVFRVNDNKVMKISTIPCYETIEKIKNANNMPKIYQHSVLNIGETNLDIYIRDDVVDVPSESFHLSKFIFDAFTRAVDTCENVYGKEINKCDFEDCMYMFRESISDEYDDLDCPELTSDEKLVVEQYISAIENYFNITGKFYRDYCSDNFGIFNGEYIVRDFEGFFSKVPEQIPEYLNTIILNETSFRI